MAERAEFGAPRQVLLDDRGTGLRVTWHAESGVAVISLWREGRCIGTFRAKPADMSALISYLAGSLASTAAQAGDTELSGIA